MKLVGELKEKVEKTTTKEGAKEVIKKAGMELNNEELDHVAGGVEEGEGEGRLFRRGEGRNK